jgi:autotransporter-associated beta strand protein
MKYLRQSSSAVRRSSVALTLAFLVSLAVNDARAQTVLIDLGNVSSFRGASQVGADDNGNFWTSVWSGAFYSDVVDLTGTATTLDFGFSGSPLGTDSFNGPAGATTNPITPTQVDNTVINSSALGLLGGSKAAAFDYYTDSKFVLQGLNSSLTYDLTLFGSHKFNANNVTRYTTYTDNTFATTVSSTTLTVGVGSAHNQGNVAALNAMAPQTGNTLYVGFAGDGGTGVGYLNSLSLYGYLGFLGGGTNTLNSGSTYVPIGNYPNGDSRSVDTVIGTGTTVEVNNASGIYFNSTLVMTNGGGTIDRGVNFTIYALTGAGNLALTGANGLTISKGGSYSGTMTMTGGSLTLNSNGGLGTGNLVLNGGSLVVNAAQGLGTGTITVASGTTTLNNSSALSALTGNNNYVLQGGGATFQVWGNGQNLNLGTGSVGVTGFNNLNAFDGGMQWNGVISGSGTLNWYGSGSLTLGGANTFSGTLIATANGGSVVLSNLNALQNATLNMGTNQTLVFGVAGANTYNVGALTSTNPASSINLGANTMNAGGNNATTTYAGSVSGTGGLTKSGTGTLKLTGSNTVTGVTTVAGGTLELDTVGGDALSGTTNVAVNAAATLLISQTSQVNDGAAITLSGGTIAKGAGGINETMGALTLGSTSFLDFGAGTGNFTFASYSPGIFKLTLQNFNLGNSLTVTTGTFTASEFAFNGFGYDWDDIPSGGFTITAVPESSTVLAALGLAGMMLWPMRRFVFRSPRCID